MSALKKSWTPLAKRQPDGAARPARKQNILAMSQISSPIEQDRVSGVQLAPIQRRYCDLPMVDSILFIGNETFVSRSFLCKSLDPASKCDGFSFQREWEEMMARVQRLRPLGRRRRWLAGDGRVGERSLDISLKPI